MTHLKYQHLNVDILLVGLAAAVIPLQGKGKTQGKFCDKSDEEVWWPTRQGQALG